MNNMLKTYRLDNKNYYIDEEILSYIEHLEQLLEDKEAEIEAFKKGE